MYNPKEYLNHKQVFTPSEAYRPRLEAVALACPAKRWLLPTLDTMGFKDLSMMSRSLEEAA
jgi:hypothetical protein